MIFDEPQAFDEFVFNNPCICLTATPGGNESCTEKEVLKHLGFNVLGGMTNSEVIKLDKTINDDELFNFINKQQRPVIIYCNEQLAETMYSSNLNMNIVKDEDMIKHDALKNLEQ